MVAVKGVAAGNALPTSPPAQNRKPAFSATPKTQAQPAGVLPLSALGREHFAGLGLVNKTNAVRFGNDKSTLEASVPVIDLAKLSAARTEAEKNAFAKDFGKKLQQYGFVALKNHGIPKTLLDAHYKLLEKLMTETPVDELKKYEVTEIGRQLGYYPAVEIKPDKDGKYTAPDPKHMWQSGGVFNVYPLEAKAFAAANYRLMKRMETVGGTIVDVLSRFLNDDAGVLRRYVYSGKNPGVGHMMRAIHYPKLNRKEREDVRYIVDKNGNRQWVRTGEHRDLSLFTLLPEATLSGLQLLPNVSGNKTDTIRDAQDPGNRWLDVFAQDGYLILNSGDALKYMTEGLTDKNGESLAIPSTWHRVVGDAQLVDFDRFSMPFFFNGNWLNTMPHLATGKPVRREEEPYNGTTFDPGLRMLWARYGRSGTVNLPYDEYQKNYEAIEATIRQVMAKRNLAAAYHSGAPM